MPTIDPITLTKLRLCDLPNGTYGAAEIATGVEEWYRFAISYKDAGDRLASSIDDSRKSSLLGTPMMFMYATTSNFL